MPGAVKPDSTPCARRGAGQTAPPDPVLTLFHRWAEANAASDHLQRKCKNLRAEMIGRHGAPSAANFEARHADPLSYAVKEADKAGTEVARIVDAMMDIDATTLAGALAKATVVNAVWSRCKRFDVSWEDRIARDCLVNIERCLREAVT
jgi:hypothetical protein